MDEKEVRFLSADKAERLRTIALTVGYNWVGLTIEIEANGQFINATLTKMWNQCCLGDLNSAQI